MWADLYALIMAQALFLEGRHNQIATFHAFVRKTPHNAAYMVTAGQNIAAEWLDKNWKFTDRDLRVLAKKDCRRSANRQTGAYFLYLNSWKCFVMQNRKSAWS